MPEVSIEQAIQTAAALRKAGRVDEAKALYAQVVQADPGRVTVWHELGVIALSEGRFEDAEKFTARAMALAPGNGPVASDHGVALSMLGRFEEAAACFRRVLAVHPALGLTHYCLANVLVALGRDDEAVEAFGHAIRLLPDYAAAYNNLGNVWQRKGALAEAASCFRRAAQLQPDLMQAHCNLGGVLGTLGHLEEAIASSRRAIALHSDLAHAHHNLGSALWRKGEFAQARASFERALSVDAQFADAHLGRAFCLLAAGRFEEGWPVYERRWLSTPYASARRGFRQPQWGGAPLPSGGTLLIHAEQGFGDTLHFMRYVPLACGRSGAARVVVECQRELIGLLAGGGEWGAEVIPRGLHDDAALPPFDVHVPLLSLPFALKHYAPLPMSAPYVAAPPHLRAAWRERLAAVPGFRTGLVWAGKADHLADRYRTIHPDRLLPLLRVEGAAFFSLQVGRREDTPAHLLAGAGLRDLTENIADFADTAALIAELDLVITVDTSVAHLAGAIGKPVWTLLPFAPDWRWGLEREGTPWYPSMRLFRQPSLGDWDSVIGRVAGELRVQIASAPHPPPDA
jgi:tetratricopeptide (TPR) repeat protein